MFRILKIHLRMSYKNVSDWLVDNKLSLHLRKTESIIFGSQKRLKKKKELNVVCIMESKMIANLVLIN